MEKEKILKWSDRLTDIFLCALLFVLPFSVSLVEISFVCLLISWITARSIRKVSSGPLINVLKPEKTDLNIPIYIFMLVCLASVLSSAYLLTSVRGFIIKSLKWVILYFIIVETINDISRLKKILITILVSILVTGADAVYQFKTGADFIRHFPYYYYYFPRISSSFGSPNDFAGWLVVMIALLFTFLFFLNMRSINKINKSGWFAPAFRFLLLLLICFLTAALMMTGSRGGWIALMLAIVFLIIFIDKRMLLILGIVMLILYVVIPKTNIRYRVAEVVKVDMSEKAALWKEAISIIKDYPVFGCGFNTYATVGPTHKISGGGGVYPHNCYLHLAAETGILGLGAFLWIIVTIYTTSLKNLRKIRHSFYGVMLIGLLAGLFGFLAQSFVDTNFYAFQLSILMWFWMGLIVAVQKIALKDIDGESAGRVL